MTLRLTVTDSPLSPNSRSSNLLNRPGREGSDQLSTPFNRVSGQSSDEIFTRGGLTAEPSQLAYERGRSDTLRTLSLARSYVDLAQNATAKADSLLTRLTDLAETTDGALLTPERAAAVQEEATALLTEISTITAEAEFNGVTVIESGNQRFSFDLDGSEDSSLSRFSVDVPNVSLSLRSLGISTLTGEHFTNPESTSATVATLEQAAQVVNANDAALGSVSTKINSFAQSIGLSTDATERFGNGAGDTNSDSLTRFLSHGPDSLLNAYGDLYSQRVTALLQEDSSEAEPDPISKGNG